MRTWKMIVPFEPPSQNDVAHNKGDGRFGYKRVRDRFELVLRNQRQLLRIPTATHKRRVIVVRLYAGRGRDRDRGNLIGGCKPILDAMHRLGLLVDDAPKWVEDHYDQRRWDTPGTFIQLEEICESSNDRADQTP